MQFPGIVTDPGFDRIEQVQEVADLCSEEAPLSEKDKETMEILREELGTKFPRRC